MESSVEYAPLNLDPCLTFLFAGLTQPILSAPATSLLDRNGGRIDRAEVRKRAGETMLRGLPTFKDCDNRSQEWAIVGGGPSINDCVDEIRALKQRGVYIVTVNKSHDWALENGIVPWGHVLLDPKEWVAGYVSRPRNDVRYFVASQCHADTFEALKDYPVYVWHAGQEFDVDGKTISEPGDYLRTHWPTTPWFMLPGPTSVAPRAIHLGAAMAPVRVRKFHLFGLDSSRSSGRMHAYSKTEAPDAHSGQIMAKHQGRGFVFDTNSHMARQWADFDKFAGEHRAWIADGRLPKGFSLTVYGSGLLPFYAAGLGWHANPKCNEDPSEAGGYIDTVSLPTPTTLYGTGRSVIFAPQESRPSV